MQTSNIEVVNWCYKCSAEPAVGDVLLRADDGEEIEVPIGWTCLQQFEAEGHDIAGFAEFKHLLENTFNWKPGVDQPPLF